MLSRVTGSKPPSAYFVPVTASPHSPAAAASATAGRRSHGPDDGTAWPSIMMPPIARSDQCDRKESGTRREPAASTHIPGRVTHICRAADPATRFGGFIALSPF
jgi:hypothetical protein